MKRILVAYATMSGSTAEVAQAVGEEIAKSDFQVDVLPIDKVGDVDGYDGIVVGAPMIMGWHRGALRFLKENKRTFQRIPLAVFVVAMSLTEASDMSVGDVDIYVDDKLPKQPHKEGVLNFRERYARIGNYLRPILRAASPSEPASIGVFGGRLEYGRLKWWAVLFVMLVVQAPAGERRNWPAIRSWAAGLPALFKLEAKGVDHRL